MAASCEMQVKKTDKRHRSNVTSCL